MTSRKVSRRSFMTNVALAGAGLTIVPRHVLGRGFTAPSDPRTSPRSASAAGPHQPHQPRQPKYRRAVRCRLGIRDKGRSGPPISRAARTARDRRHRASLAGATGRGAQRDRPRANPPQHRAHEAAQERAPAARGALSGLPPDARTAEGHRRRGRRDARSHARDDRDGGDGSRASTSTCRSR